MSKSVERRIKIQHAHAAQWIERLKPGQVRALAHQHQVESAMTQDIERLRTDLLMIPDVRKLAGEPDGQTETQVVQEE